MLTLRKVGLIEEANQKNFIYYQAEVVFLQGSYTAAVYFADNEVTNPVAGADLVAKGTDAGGCVEVYKTAEDAKKRNDYLSAFDGFQLSSTLGHTMFTERLLFVSQHH